MNKETCTVDGCEKPARGRGWCSKHYQRWRNHGHPELIRPAVHEMRCAHCGGEYVTGAAHQKYCGPRCRAKAGNAARRPWNLTCQLCGTEYQGRSKDGKYCSGCAYAGRESAISSENFHIYKAIRGGSAKDVLDAILGRCIVTESGCWEWQGSRTSGGYGTITTGRTRTSSSELTHRVAYEYAIGTKPEGMTVHHKCANRPCCNPDHLQLATQRDNMAEMYARKAYETRIAQLRAALSEYNPSHPLLG